MSGKEVRMRKWLLNQIDEIGCYCNEHPYDKYAYNIYLIMCKLVGWL